MSSNLDQGIEKNLDAALIQNNVKYSVKRGVVTLSGEVNSREMRTQARSRDVGCAGRHALTSDKWSNRPGTR